MKIIRNSLIPIGNRFAAINILGMLFVKGDIIITEHLINHERIHSAQMRELLYIPFYILYVAEWLILLFRYCGNFQKAYRNISFEREAYLNERNLHYLRTRKRFAQWQ